MAADIGWLLALMVLLCSIIPSTDALLFGRTASSILTIADHVSTTTTPASCEFQVRGFEVPADNFQALSDSSPTPVVPGFDYEKAEAAPWCSWGQCQQYSGYEMHCVVDYFQGGDLFGQWANNIDDCVATCNDTSGCNFLSYQAENDDGLYGMCWLKREPSGVRRHDTTILGMLRVAAPASPDSSFASSEASSTSSTVVPSYSIGGLSTSTLSMSLSIVPTSTPVTTSSSKASPASTTGSSSSSTTFSPATSAAVPTPTADQGESGRHTSVSPPFWFSEAHPCHPKECSSPATTYGKTSYPSMPVSFSSSKVTTTKSVVTTKVFLSGRTSIAEPMTKTTTFVEYSKASMVPTYSKTLTMSSVYSLPSVSPGYIRSSSSHGHSWSHYVSSSSKSQSVPSPLPSSSTTEVLSQSSSSSYLCAVVTGKTTCTSHDNAVSTKTTFTTTTLAPGTKTTTIYKTMSSQSSKTAAVTSSSKTYVVSGPTTNGTAVSGVSTTSGKPTSISNITESSKTTVTSEIAATHEASVSSGSASTKSVLSPGPTPTSGATTSTATTSLTSKITQSTKTRGSSKPTTSGVSSVASSISASSKYTASGPSTASSVSRKFSTTISDNWKDPSTWYVPTPTGHTTATTSTGRTKSAYTADHYSHPESSSAVTTKASSASSSATTTKASSSGNTYPSPVYLPSSSTSIVTVTSQGFS